MTIEEAIQMAIEYETNVKSVYTEAIKTSKDSVGQRIYQVLSDEEQGHLDYLHYKLEELKKTGEVTPETLETYVPSEAVIRKGVEQLESRMAEADKGHEIELLKKALDVERETSAFYKKMVATLDDDGRRLFERFVEIEEGHVAIVQAEMDLVSGTGFWFDTAEFGLEKA